MATNEVPMNWMEYHSRRSQENARELGQRLFPMQQRFYGEFQTRPPRYFGEPPITMPQNIFAPDPVIQQIMQEQNVTAKEARKIKDRMEFEADIRRRNAINKPEEIFGPRPEFINMPIGNLLQAASEGDSEAQSQLQGLLSSNVITSQNVDAPPSQEPTVPVLNQEVISQSVQEEPFISGKGAKVTGLLSQQEKPVMQPRAQGILGTLGDLFGVNQPDFRDRLVMGLGALTFDPSNPLTQQASANIASRRQAEQAELDRQARLQIAQEQMRSAESIAQADREAAAAEPSNAFLTEQREWITTGRNTSINSMENLGRALEILQDPTIEPTGFVTTGLRKIPILGQYLEARGGRFGAGATAQQLVEQVLSENLRDILGGQFAQLEGFRYLERGYNPFLSREENIKRVSQLYNTIQRIYDAKNQLYSGSITEQEFSDLVGSINQQTYRTDSNGNVFDASTGDQISSLDWNSEYFSAKADPNFIRIFGEDGEMWNNMELDDRQEYLDQYYSVRPQDR